MHSSRCILILPTLALLAACNGGSGAPMPDGPPHMGIVAGNNQRVTAAPTVPLPAQVVAQIVRLPSGAVSLRILDAVLPPKAYAQTAVNGIPGAVVCAVSPDPKHALTPEVPCTNTDLAGKAYFTFRADTVAGVSRSEVRGTVNGTTRVSDSVTAVVAPDSVVRLHVARGNGDGSVYPAAGEAYLGARAAGYVVDLAVRVDTVVDRYSNRLAPADWPLEWAFTATVPTLAAAATLSLPGRGLSPVVPAGAPAALVIRIGRAVHVFALRWGSTCGAVGMQNCDPPTP